MRRRLHAMWLVAALMLAGSACKRPDAPAPASSPPGPGAAELRALDRARAAARELAVTLRKKLLEAFRQGGAVAAIDVCAASARRLGAEVAERTGVRVGRASLRLRNPASAPPAWVAEWLRRQGERPAAGVEGFSDVDPRRARVILPIAVEPLCVTCHGPRERLAPEIRLRLSRHYPADRAVGYRVGDLRGALWAEAPVAR